MKLGIFAGPYTPEHVEAVLEAERVGFDSIWGGENYGADCFSTMGWWAAQTKTIKLATIVSIIDARAPAMTAMSAMTLDMLSGGRYTLGLGVSGPQVVEGWYGQPFSKPIARTREYISIVRKVMERKDPLTFDGEFYKLPYPGGTGLGKPLKTILHPVRPRQPIHLAAEGPKNVAMAAELADGWTAFYLSPHTDAFYRDCLAEGFAKRPGGRPENFEIVGQIQLSMDDDLETAVDRVRPHVAFMVGGMGSPEANYHYNALARVGYEAECVEIHKRWSEGDRKGSATAVTPRMVEEMALVGSADKIRHDLDAWRESAITILLPSIMGRPVDPPLVRLLADLVLNK